MYELNFTFGIFTQEFLIHYTKMLNLPFLCFKSIKMFVADTQNGINLLGDKFIPTITFSYPTLNLMFAPNSIGFAMWLFDDGQGQQVAQQEQQPHQEIHLHQTNIHYHHVHQYHIRVRR